MKYEYILSCAGPTPTPTPENAIVGRTVKQRVIVDKTGTSGKGALKRCD